MDKFFNLENSSSIIQTKEKELNEDEILNNVFEKINYLQYDFITNIVNEIINNSIFNIKVLKDNKIERAEKKLLNKIYEKFNITKNLSIAEIDLVYTYIHYNKNYSNSKENFNLKNLDPKILSSFKEEKKENFYDFLLNIEITKKNLPFIRNVYIITPTADYLEDVEKFIVIPIEEICGKDDYNKIYFRPCNVVKYLNEVRGLSNIFLFGNQDCICIKNIKKDNFIKDGIPITYLQKKQLQRDGNIKNIEEYNTNKLFQNKFDIFFKLVNINQLTIVRKDCIDFTLKLFNENINIDFLLLQYLTGYFFYLYDIKTTNNDNFSGFYSNTQKNLYERMFLIKNKKTDFFCINYLNKSYVQFYLHACLINMDIIENKIVRNIFFVIDKENKNMKYRIPSIERTIKDVVSGSKIEFFLMDDEKIVEYNGKLGDALYLAFDFPYKKLQHLKHIVLEINEKTSISDILYYMNIECKISSGDRIVAHYPEKVIKNLEEKYNIPLTKMLKIVNLDSGVKLGSIAFNKEIEKSV